MQYSLKELPSLQTAYDWCSVNVVEDSFVTRTFSTEGTIDDMSSGEDAGPFQVILCVERLPCTGKQNEPPFRLYVISLLCLVLVWCCPLVCIAGAIAGLDQACSVAVVLARFPPNTRNSCRVMESLCSWVKVEANHQTCPAATTTWSRLIPPPPRAHPVNAYALLLGEWFHGRAGSGHRRNILGDDSSYPRRQDPPGRDNPPGHFHGKTFQASLDYENRVLLPLLSNGRSTREGWCCVGLSLSPLPVAAALLLPKCYCCVQR